MGLQTPDRELIAVQSSNTTKVQLGKPMRLLGLVCVTRCLWGRDTLLIAAAKAASLKAHSRKPTKRQTSRMLSAPCRQLDKWGKVSSPQLSLHVMTMGREGSCELAYNDLQSVVFYK